MLQVLSSIPILCATTERREKTDSIAARRRAASLHSDAVPNIGIMSDYRFAKFIYL